jgi:GTP-binding protein Era
MNDNAAEFKSGFVAIAGAPNVGKSTLLNRILGEKLSITSRKPQTTRNRILGVVHRTSAQFVFIDTPGIHTAKTLLNTRIVDVALTAIGDADLVLVVGDAVTPDAVSEQLLAAALKKRKQPAILALNKIDLVEKERLLHLIDAWSQTHSFEAVVPVSAKLGIQIETLLQAIEGVLPYGPPYFSEEEITDMPERFIAAEMIREKVFRYTGQEIPYAIAVSVDSFSEDIKNSLVRIHATIHVERDSQKGIIIGKGGKKLKTIGEAARKEIERLVGARVFLKILVRVQKNWSKDTRALRKFGYL